MDHLAHPFDDAFFQALAGSRGIVRDQLPTDYDPGHDWGNDSITTELPGMPGFSFMCGDDAWHGSMALYLQEFTYRRTMRDQAEVSIPVRLTQIQISALSGCTCDRVLDAPVIGGWRVIRAEIDEDDPDATLLMLEVPI